MGIDCSDEQVGGPLKLGLADIRHVLIRMSDAVPMQMKMKVNDVIEQLGGSRNDAQTLQQRGNCLRRELSSKSVLLLIDNVWDREQLEAMQQAAQRTAPGSLVLVTSRSRWPTVLRYAFEVKGLSPEAASRLFLSRAEVPLPLLVDDVECIMEEIVVACCGLPLMVEIAGSSLKSNAHEPQRWQVCAAQHLLPYMAANCISARCRRSLNGNSALTLRP